MSGSIAQLLAWLHAQNRHAAELVRKRDLAAFGEVRRVGAAWVWQLHQDGLPGALAALVGPRYCPSIEDKINRFAGKDSHQIFLEPEGLTTHEVYPNGISTSLPFDIQLAAVRSMAGLENAHILRPGYAIEYDYFDPRELKSSFETRSIGGLFFAGQINGTTG